MSSSVETRNYNWKTLAWVDARLTRTYIDSDNFLSHKILVEDEEGTRENSEELQNFLEEQYQSSRQIVSFEPINYVPSAGFQQLGVLSKQEIVAGEVINGLSGFLSELPDSDHVEGYNDFSLITRSRKLRQTFLMLGPISFINSSCRRNARYEIRNFAVRCVSLKAIKPGEEIVEKMTLIFFENSTKVAYVSLLIYMVILWKINFRNESVN